MSKLYKSNFLQLVLFVFLIGCGKSDANDLQKKFRAENNSIDTSYFEQVVPPITIGEIEKVTGSYKPGHGPYVWYYSKKDHNRRIWIWIMPEEGQEIGRATVEVVVDIDPMNTADAIVIWPDNYKHMDVVKVLKSVYGSQMQF